MNKNILISLMVTFLMVGNSRENGDSFNYGPLHTYTMDLVNNNREIYVPNSAITNNNNGNNYRNFENTYNAASMDEQEFYLNPQFYKPVHYNSVQKSNAVYQDDYEANKLEDSYFFNNNSTQNDNNQRDELHETVENDEYIQPNILNVNDVYNISLQSDFISNRDQYDAILNTTLRHIEQDLQLSEKVRTETRPNLKENIQVSNNNSSSEKPYVYDDKIEINTFYQVPQDPVEDELPPVNINECIDCDSQKIHKDFSKDLRRVSNTHSASTQITTEQNYLSHEDDITVVQIKNVRNGRDTRTPHRERNPIDKDGRSVDQFSDSMRFKESTLETMDKKLKENNQKDLTFFQNDPNVVDDTLLFNTNIPAKTNVRKQSSDALVGDSGNLNKVKDFDNGESQSSNTVDILKNRQNEHKIDLVEITNEIEKLKKMLTCFEKDLTNLNQNDKASFAAPSHKHLIENHSDDQIPVNHQFIAQDNHKNEIKPDKKLHMFITQSQLKQILNNVQKEEVKEHDLDLTNNANENNQSFNSIREEINKYEEKIKQLQSLINREQRINEVKKMIDFLSEEKSETSVHNTPVPIIDKLDKQIVELETLRDNIFDTQNTETRKPLSPSDVLSESSSTKFGNLEQILENMSSLHKSVNKNKQIARNNLSGFNDDIDNNDDDEDDEDDDDDDGDDADIRELKQIFQSLNHKPVSVINSHSMKIKGNKFNKPSDVELDLLIKKSLKNQHSKFSSHHKRKEDIENELKKLELEIELLKSESNGVIQEPVNKKEKNKDIMKLIDRFFHKKSLDASVSGSMDHEENLHQRILQLQLKNNIIMRMLSNALRENIINNKTQPLSDTMSVSQSVEKKDFNDMFFGDSHLNSDDFSNVFLSSDKVHSGPNGHKTINKYMSNDRNKKLNPFQQYTIGNKKHLSGFSNEKVQPIYESTLNNGINEEEIKTNQYQQGYISKLQNQIDNIRSQITQLSNIVLHSSNNGHLYYSDKSDKTMDDLNQEINNLQKIMIDLKNQQNQNNYFPYNMDQYSNTESNLNDDNNFYLSQQDINDGDDNQKNVPDYEESRSNKNKILKIQKSKHPFYSVKYFPRVSTETSNRLNENIPRNPNLSDKSSLRQSENYESSIRIQDYPSNNYEGTGYVNKPIQKSKFSKKDSLFEKIFRFIVQRKVHKLGIIGNVILSELFGIDTSDNYDNDYSGTGYSSGGLLSTLFGGDDDVDNYGHVSPLLSIFRNMGIIGIIPAIIVKLLSKLSLIVRVLQRNTFISSFLIPAGVLLIVNASIIFLVWWLFPQDCSKLTIGSSYITPYPDKQYPQFNYQNLGINSDGTDYYETGQGQSYHSNTGY